MPSPARLAASAAAPAAASVPAKPAAAAEPAFALRSGLVHGEPAASELIPVQIGGGFLRFFVGRHLDKRETPCAAGCRIAHHADRFHGARTAEQFLQLRLARRVWQIPDVKPSTHHTLS